MAGIVQLLEAVGLGLVVLLPLANPLSTVVVFLGLSGGMPEAERQRQAALTGLYVFAITVTAFYGGQAIMDAFGISIPGLRIGGGLIVCSVGFSMLLPKAALDHTPEVEDSGAELKSYVKRDIAFVPLAMPTTAGPGTIAMIIAMAATVQDAAGFQPWVLRLAPVLVCLTISVIVWLCLRSAGPILRFVGRSGVEAVSRLMGFLLVCMGVQFIINGVVEIIRTQLGS